VETYASFPPLAYLLAALAMTLAHDDVFWAARAVSYGSYIGTVAVTYLLARRLLPDRPLVALSTGCIVALLPQFAFTGAYFNPDALAVFETSLVLWMLIEVRQHGPRPLLVLVLGGILGSLLLTKYPFYPAVGVFVLSGLALQWRDQGRWRGAALLLLGITLTAGWWFVRNQQLYGELIPSRVVAAAKAAAGGNTLLVPARQGLNLWDVTVTTDFWEVTLQSFVGVFGPLTIFLDPQLYLACAVAVGLGAIGIALHVHRAGQSGRQLGLAAVLGGLTVVTLLSALAISTYGEYSPQGRYLFPLLVPLCLLVAVGWEMLAHHHWSLRWVSSAGLVGAAALNLVCLLGYVVPHEFGPEGRVVLVQIDQPGAAVPADAPLEVKGWSFLRGGSQWRPFDPEVLLTYRRPIGSISVWLDGPPGTGRWLGPASVGLSRPDVEAMYGGVDELGSVGFRLLLSDHPLPPGGHRLYVCATPPSVPHPTCSSREFQAA
jgi:4-amino-4-deoxy-L-arabinose transferase-like glycosyltransferase